MMGRAPFYTREPLLTRVLWFTAGAVFMAGILLAVVLS
jgi:hypothetical protein